MNTPPGLETYLGDGVFASHDGCEFIKLRCQRENGANVIYLDRDTFASLLQWLPGVLFGQVEMMPKERESSDDSAK